MAKYINEQSAMVTRYEVTAKIWFGPDGKVYEDGSQPDGSQLIATPGKTLTKDEAVRYGLLKSDEPAEDKAAEPAEDKARSTRSVKRTKKA
jgi:hypothetical protein